jgi:hypothetical protein
LGMRMMEQARARARPRPVMPTVPFPGPTAPGRYWMSDAVFAERSKLRTGPLPPHPPVAYDAVIIAERIASDPASQQALEQAAVRVRKTGVRDDSSPMLLLLVVILWLIAVGLPVIQAELPGKAQGIGTNEVATVGLALAITWRVLDKRKKSE